LSRALRRQQARESRGAKGAGAAASPIPRTRMSRPNAAAVEGGGGVLGWRPRFLMDIVSELRKVNWPTREDTTYLTVVVVIVTIILGAILGAIDIGFGWLIDNTLLR